MNCMFLIDSLNGGGAERACLNIASHFCDKHSVLLVMIFKADPPGYYVDPRIKTIYLDIENHRSLLRKSKYYYQAISRIKKVKKQYKVDCCISFLETANLFNVLSCAGERTVVSARNYYSVSQQSGSRRNIRRIKALLAGKKADINVAVSKAVAYDLIRNYAIPREKVTVIYNMYDADPVGKTRNDDIFNRFLSVREEATTLFISTGRLVFQKGHWHLIRAFRKVADSIKGAKLVILGQGPYREYLLKVIESNKLENDVFLLGFDPGVKAYIEKSDIYVCSSLEEGFSNSMLEAFAEGLPVISADCKAGPRELLAPDTDYNSETRSIEKAEYGILVPKQSGNDSLQNELLEVEEDIMAEAMIDLASHTDWMEMYRKKSRERIKEFSPSAINRKWETVVSNKTEGINEMPI